MSDAPETGPSETTGVFVEKESGTVLAIWVHPEVTDREAVLVAISVGAVFEVCSPSVLTSFIMQDNGGRVVDALTHADYAIFNTLRQARALSPDTKGIALVDPGWVSRSIAIGAPEPVPDTRSIAQPLLDEDLPDEPPIAVHHANSSEPPSSDDEQHDPDYGRGHNPAPKKPRLSSSASHRVVYTPEDRVAMAHHLVSGPFASASEAWTIFSRNVSLSPVAAKAQTYIYLCS